MSKKDIASEMKPLVNQYHQSGQSRKAFASVHGISEAKLTYWLRKFSKTVNKTEGNPSSVNFVPLEVKPSPLRVSEPLVIRLVSGVEIEIPL